MRNNWILGLVLTWTCAAQPPVKTPIELQEELESGLHGWSDRLEIIPPATRPWMDVRSPAPLDRPTGASVSVSQLGHKIPRAALKSYTRANQFSKKGEPARAAAELEGAIGLDPQFAEAYTNLGVAYGQLGRFDEATAALRRSLELDPHSSMAHYNMGIVLYKIGDIAGAVQSARRAVAESSENAWAHLLLGGLLSGKEATRTEGLQHIEVAARSLPLAREFIRSFTPPQ